MKNITQLTPQGVDKVLSEASKAWENVQKLNEQIKSTDDELLKISLRQEKHAICIEQEQHLLGASYMIKDPSGFGNYRIKFFHADEDGEFSKIINKYGHFRPENELDNVMILEIKNTYEGLKEKINQSLIERDISEEKQEYLWKCMLSSYNELLEKSKTYEQQVKSKQDTILKQMSLSTADHYYQTLERDHKKEIEGLKFKSNQLVKQFKAQGLSMLGQLPEESETILELKDIIGGFKEKIDKHLTDNNIHNKIKSDVFKLFGSKLDQQLDQLKQIEKNVKRTEEKLIYANNLEGFKATQGSLRTYQQQIDKWKLESDKLTEDMTNKAIEFSYQMPHLQPVLNEPQLIQPVVNIIPNQQNDLIIEESEMDLVVDDSLSIITTHSVILNQSSLIINPIIPNEESVAILKIKSLLDGFEKKLNDSLNDNSNIINEKIKSAIYKIYHPKCKKHLEKLELIEKSIKKYEDLPNSQKTEKIINHLKQRYKQIDKWELDSDDLIETITMKALELSCKTEPEVNQQNNLHVQKLSDQVTELTKIIDKISQNPMGIPPIDSVHQDEYDSSFQDLNQSIKSSSWQIEGFSENNPMGGLGIQEPNVENKEKELKKAKWKGEVKGEIKHIKMGIKKAWLEDEIKEDLKYTKNHLTEIINHFISHEEDFITKGNESLLVENLGNNGWISDSE